MIEAMRTGTRYFVCSNQCGTTAAEYEYPISHDVIEVRMPVLFWFPNSVFIGFASLTREWGDIPNPEVLRSNANATRSLAKTSFRDFSRAVRSLETMA